MPPAGGLRRGGRWQRLRDLGLGRPDDFDRQGFRRARRDRRKRRQDAGASAQGARGIDPHVEGPRGDAVAAGADLQGQVADELALPGSTAVIRNSDEGFCGDGATITLQRALAASCATPGNFSSLGLRYFCANDPAVAADVNANTAQLVALMQQKLGSSWGAADAGAGSSGITTSTR